MALDAEHGSDSLLSALELALDGTEEWTPDAGARTPAALPGRRPGEALETRTHPVAGVRAVVSDCGTSRMPGFTHVLLLSEQALTILGATYAKLGQAIADKVGSEAFAWEEGVHLHVNAAGRVWEDVLRTARDAVASLAEPEAAAG